MFAGLLLWRTLSLDAGSAFLYKFPLVISGSVLRMHPVALLVISGAVLKGLNTFIQRYAQYYILKWRK